MKIFYKLFVFLLLNLLVVFNVYAAKIQNPLLHFYTNYEIFKEDKILLYKVDLNEDGHDEFFISTDSPRRNNSKAGILYELYISEDKNYFHYNDKSTSGISFSAGHLVRLNNGRLAIIHYHASNARSGSIVAYSLNKNNVVEYTELGNIYAQPGEFQKKYKVLLDSTSTPVEKKKYSADFKAYELIKLYSPEQITALKSYKDDFWATHNFRSDPDSSNDLVYRKSDGKFVGYLVDSQFVPAKKEDKHNNLGAKK